MITWQLYHAIGFVFLAGVFDAAQTRRKDYCFQSCFYRWWKNSPRMLNWYIGGNDHYNPSWPWTADFWHTMKFGWIYSWSIACGFLAWGAMHEFYMGVIATLLFQAIEGTTFSQFYHKFFS